MYRSTTSSGWAMSGHDCEKSTIDPSSSFARPRVASRVVVERQVRAAVAGTRKAQRDASAPLEHGLRRERSVLPEDDLEALGDERAPDDIAELDGPEREPGRAGSR